MRERRADRTHAHRPPKLKQQHAAHPIELWRLRGATDDLRGLVIETSFGHAFGLELDAELVLLHLQPSLKCLVAYADRLESALIKQGWRAIEEPLTGRSAHVSH